MSGKWDDPSVPKSGWTCTGVTDLFDEDDPDSFAMATCEMCEVQEIRFVHHMTHPRHEPLDTGCICAGNMEGNPFAAGYRESEVRRISERRRNWLRRKWRVSRNGNEFLNVDGFNVVIFAQHDGFGAKIEHRESYDPAEWLEVPAPTVIAAKLAAFDRLMFRLRSG